MKKIFINSGARILLFLILVWIEGCVTVPDRVSSESQDIPAVARCSLPIVVNFSKVTMSAFDVEMLAEETTRSSILEMKRTATDVFAKFGYNVVSEGGVGDEGTVTKIKVKSVLKLYSSSFQKSFLQISTLTLGIIPVISDGEYYVEVSEIGPQSKGEVKIRSSSVKIIYLNGDLSPKNSTT